jgi:HEAT repeat protein
MRSSALAAPIALLLALPLAPPLAAAEVAKPRVEAAAGAAAGLGAVAVRLDVTGRTLLLRGCASLPCDAGAGAATPIALPEGIDAARSSARVVEIGEGRRVVHVVAGSATREGIAWEALAVGAGAGGQARLLYQGLTGFGAESEGAGGHVDVDDGTVFVGTIKRELTICGQSETLLSPRRLDPKTLVFHAVSFSRLPKGVRDAAPTIVAVPAKEAPIGSVLGVRGASSNDGASSALVDDDAKTAWTEARKGDGRGEFVVLSAPPTIPLTRLSIVVRPTVESPGFVPPAALWVVVDGATYHVELPAKPAPGARVDVQFPKPISTACVAVALDRTDVPALAAGVEPAVGLAEIEGVPELPATIHSLDDLVGLLDFGGADAELARKVLANAGPKGARAVTARLSTMSDAAKARAVDILDQTPCEAAGPGLVRLAWDARGDVARAARDALDGCGAAARGALAEGFAAGPDNAREVLAERWAKVDPGAAVPAILARIEGASAARRRSFRAALARAAARGAGRDAIAAWLDKDGKAAAPEGKLDLVIELARAIATVDEVTAASAGTSPLATKLVESLLPRADAKASFERRYLAAEPLAALAAKGDARALAWMRALFATDDRYLRARAAEVAGGIDLLRPELVASLGDGDPRVRKSALDALRRSGGAPGAWPTVLALLANDGWTFVRVAAADAIGEANGAGTAGDLDVALAKATRDPAKQVRAASVRALAKRHARSQLPAVRSRAFDEGETIDVRREAIEALGALCDDAAVDDLYDIVRKSGGQGELGLAAIKALGEIHPKDLEARLQPANLEGPAAKDAAVRALRTPPRCKGTP